MAKGKKSPVAKKPETVLDAEVAQKVTTLKNEGNKMFAERDYTKAIEQYEEAMKMLPDGAAERADLLCNKAACFYAVNKLKEAVKECGTALEVAPNSIKALRHRAKALEKQGLYKQALTDIQAINKTESASDDSREAERRLKDLVAGRRPSLANGGARAAGPTGSQAARGTRSFGQWPFSAKCSLGNETRLVQLTASAGYGDLQQQIKTKFPNAGDVVLKYVDKDGDLVTITNRNDVQAALTEALKQMDRRLGIIPPIRVQVVPADKADVPPVPLEESPEAQRLYQQLAAAQQAQQAAQQQALQQPKQQAQTSSGEVVEIDDFLVEFVHLFRETTGIDSDKHIDYTNEGMSTLTRAMDATLRSDAAEPLFDKAIERFKEVIASGYLNWAQVYVYRGHKALELAALDGKEDISPELAQQVLQQFDLAEAKVKEALAVKANWFDAYLQLGGIEFDRAKLASQLLVKPPPSIPEGVQEGTPEAEAATKAYNDASQANTREALAKLKADNVTKAESHIKTMEGLYKQAYESAVAYEQERKADQEARQQKQDKQQGSETSTSGKEAAAEGQQPAMTVSSHARIMYGNQLYEWSQMLAAVGKEWRPVLDEAVSCFKEAGCNEADIRGALKNHTQVDQLDLGPDPEPEQPETPAEADKPQHKPAKEAKGLPSLDRKPKADKAAA